MDVVEVARIPVQPEFLRIPLHRSLRLSSTDWRRESRPRLSPMRRRLLGVAGFMVVLGPGGVGRAERGVLLRRGLQPVAAEKRVTLGVEVPDEVRAAWPTPIIDGAAIQQALVNLLDNAVKHSPPDSSVTVGLDVVGASVPAPGSGATGASLPAVRLWVQDRGPGIPVEERQRIFERFYRPGSEMRRETQGVGIGLSIVKHIVEAHRGRVFVESEIRQGSTFVIELPLPPSLKVEETKGA